MKTYEGYYDSNYEDSGLYKNKEKFNGLYPDYLIIGDVIPEEFHDKKIKITIEEIKED